MHGATNSQHNEQTADNANDDLEPVTAFFPDTTRASTFTYAGKMMPPQRSPS